MIAASGWPASDTMASHGVCSERASDGRSQSIELVCQPLEGKQRSELVFVHSNLYLCTGFKLECDTEISHAIIIARFVYFITLLKSARQAIENVFTRKTLVVLQSCYDTEWNQTIDSRSQGPAIRSLFLYYISESDDPECDGTEKCQV
jgi:hypothetical protein